MLLAALSSAAHHPKSVSVTTDSFDKISIKIFYVIREKFSACSDKQIVVDGVCFDKVTIGAACKHQAQCPTSSICKSGLCTCPEGTTNVNGACMQGCPDDQVAIDGKCEPRVSLGETCVGSAQCEGGAECSGELPKPSATRNIFKASSFLRGHFDMRMP